MRCFFFILIGLISSFAHSVPSFIEQAPLVSAKEIVDWVDSKNPQSVKTVEELLNKLPDAYRTYFVLQYDSHSNHLSDPTHPRVIFFGADAKLLTFLKRLLPENLFYFLIRKTILTQVSQGQHFV
jgi:hypothetical protein